MNKKFYFDPEIEVVELELQGVLCASDGVDDEGGAAEDLGPGAEPYIDPNDD